MTISRVTPLILTWNEEDNIERCLKRLEWADSVVVIDSGSTDRTLDICKQFPNVSIHYNKFESHSEQQNFGLSKIETDWVLTLDADYIVPPDFGKFLSAYQLQDDAVGAFASFEYCVYGRPLRGTLYPPRLVLHRVKGARYEQDGHTQRVKITGTKMSLGVKIEHDDRKPIARWFHSQAGYTRLEALKLLTENPSHLSKQDRIRTCVWIAPWLVAFWCLFVKRCILDGPEGIFYTLQRVIAESMLAASLLDARLRGGRQ